MSEKRRRDANEIKYQILMSSNSGNKKTHIMYESGLNLVQLNKYLSELLANGAVEFRPQHKMYFLTEKGRAFARAFDGYRQTIASLDKQEAELAQFFQAAKHPVVDRSASPSLRRW